MARSVLLSSVLALSLSCAWGAGGCSPSSSSNHGNEHREGKGGNGDDGGGASAGMAPDGGPIFREPDAAQGVLSISPATLEITVDAAHPPSGTQFEVTGTGGADVTWHVTNPAVGIIDSNGVFTPGGTVGGVVQIQATFGGQKATATVTVVIERRDNGGDTSGDVDAGAGGLEGVGGEGFGGPVPEDLIPVLEGAPASDGALELLYPYDRTVFPLGVLPPLVQWKPGGHGNFEGVYVHLSAPPYYDYRGFFGRPARLGAADDFLRHPIPKDVWDGATRTAAGGELTLEVSLAAGGKAYGVLKRTFPIALAPIKGKIYYQAYNTALAHNYDSGTVSGKPMGGATLSITVGDQGPALVAGRTSSDHTGCRVCHTVSAYGDRMVVQHGDAYRDSSSIDLKNGNAESGYPSNLFGWVGLYPDGTLGLKNTVDVATLGEVSAELGLYDMTTGNPVASTGLDTVVSALGLPAFSPDGKLVAFTAFGAAENPTTDLGTLNGRQLVAMDFDYANRAFSNARMLWEAPGDDQRPAWSTFMPGSDAVVFQRRWNGTANETFATRNGARGELWWVHLASGRAAPLGGTNGVGADGAAYVPVGPNGHDRDAELNYEPSISPVASGGYAWMVFMSRRSYGNVATADPYHSDPRSYDIEKDITTKKIWMAAIDLDAKPGEDPSHPAFYIPGQELRGVNSRPFFALEPCVTDRGTCSSGVDCCTGFCRDGYCSPPPVNECSQIDERCETDSDCCASDRSRCVGGFCAVILK